MLCFFGGGMYVIIRSRRTNIGLEFGISNAQIQGLESSIRLTTEERNERGCEKLKEFESVTELT
jgi:hypothetical protein